VSEIADLFQKYSKHLDYLMDQHQRMFNQLETRFKQIGTQMAEAVKAEEPRIIVESVKKESLREALRSVYVAFDERNKIVCAAEWPTEDVGFNRKVTWVRMVELH
jgi:hypothetical protein